MKGTILKTKLHQGECVFGTHIISYMNPVAAALTAEIALDFAFFCTEHIPIDRTELSTLCHFYASRGISPIVRVPTCNETQIAAALDGGAEGIVVPYVETVEEVNRAVAAVNYRPIKGRQLETFMKDRKAIPENMQQFLSRFNASRYLIIGVESVEAMDNLESLISIDGVDGVFLGPHDITTSMGIPEEYENPKFLDAIEDVIRRCRKASVGVGIHIKLFTIREENLLRFLRAGMNWIINGSDVTIMRDAMNAQLSRLRSLTESELPSRIDAEPTLAEVQSCIT